MAKVSVGKFGATVWAGGGIEFDTRDRVDTDGGNSSLICGGSASEPDNAVPVMRPRTLAGALICWMSGALSPSPHRAACSSPRFDTVKLALVLAVALRRD